MSEEKKQSPTGAFKDVLVNLNASLKSDPKVINRTDVKASGQRTPKAAFTIVYATGEIVVIEARRVVAAN